MTPQFFIFFAPHLPLFEEQPPFFPQFWNTQYKLLNEQTDN